VYVWIYKHVLHQQILAKKTGVKHFTSNRASNIKCGKFSAASILSNSAAKNDFKNSHGKQIFSEISVDFLLLDHPIVKSLSG
jgi:hypothetical protein